MYIYIYICVCLNTEIEIKHINTLSHKHIDINEQTKVFTNIHTYIQTHNQRDTQI